MDSELQRTEQGWVANGDIDVDDGGDSDNDGYGDGGDDGDT